MKRLLCTLLMSCALCAAALFAADRIFCKYCGSSNFGNLPDYMPQIFDFIDQLKHQALPVEKSGGSKITHEEFAADLAEIRRLCKGSSLTVDSFLEERWKERDLEEAET
ncbi:hypothetical protein FACS1894137_09790 [Spirochaetia bacterium]|nr:hypothetical protein FACS1894137_09790 [Spirochaetia bacterium]